MRNFQQSATVIILLVSTLVCGGLIDHLAAQSKSKKKDPQKNKISNLFNSKCAKCHGTDGRGETVDGINAGAPDFTSSEWQAKADDRELVIVIEQGQSQMPSFRQELTREQTKSLVAYIRAFGTR